MLINFTVGNYRSFKEPVTFSLQSSGIREFSKTHVFDSPHPDISILRGAALYGPNSSGKSNLLNSIVFMSYMVLNSAKSMTGTDPLPYNRFKLSTSTAKMPSSFKMEFVYGDQIYIYGFSFNSNEILSEELKFKKKVTEATIFSREKKAINVDPKFKEGQKAIDYTRSNALFLSTAAMLNVSWAIEISKAFEKFHYLHIRVPHNMAMAGLTGNYFKNQQYSKQVDKLLLGSNLGFQEVTEESFNIQSETTDSKIRRSNSIFFGESKVKLIFTVHDQLDEKGNIKSKVNFSLDDESDGTKKYFSMIGPIVATLAEGNVLIVDEFTSHLHPILAEHLIKLFHHPKINKGNGQLIIATHNTYLLNEDLYRKDQIYFTEKDKLFATNLKRLSDPDLFKDVRQETNFEKRYIHDRQLGALPKWSVDENKFWS